MSVPAAPSAPPTPPASAPATAASARRRRLAPAARRDQILSAAAGAFARAGFADTSVAAIASSAGVTPRIVYRHFASKDALYRAVLDRAASGLGAALDRPTGRYGVDPSRLLAAARADADGFRVLWRHAAHEPPYRGVVDRVRAAALDCARAGLASWTPADAVDYAAHAVVGYQIESVCTWLEFGRVEDDPRFVRATRASLGAGVRAWSADENGDERASGGGAP